MPRTKKGLIERAKAKLELPRRLSIDARREQLLHLGLDLFGRIAYDEISIDDIAKQAGISKGLLYHYFSSKRVFYVAIVEAAAKELLEAVAPNDTLEPEARARDAIDRYLAHVEARQIAYVALLKSGIGMDPEVAEVVERARSRIGELLLEGIGVQGERPIFRAAVRSFIGAVEATCLDWLERRDVEREALLDLFMALLSAGVNEAKRLDPKAKVKI